MFWDHGYGMGWSWIWVPLVMLIVVGAIAAIVFLVVRSATGGPAAGGHQPPPYQGHAPGGASNARAIVEERLARGEVTPDEYREIVRALDEPPPPRPGA